MLRSIYACITLLWCLNTFAQCPTIQTSDFTFSTDGTCAPVNVTEYTATYTFFNTQDPADITIRFEWNDPGATVDDFTGAGLTSDNLTFEATGTFSYAAGNECGFQPQVSILYQGDECSASTQNVFVWEDDDSNGGTMAIDPGAYDVCYNTAIVGAVFTDNSTFNCNPNDNDVGVANRDVRHTQFVYGTNHPVNSIRNLTVDGNPVTDANGDLIGGGEMRGTAGEIVTAGYFGPIDEVPFPANGPASTSLTVAAPANAANIVGSTFEITLFNWNTCNPYNDDPDDPNYEDAVRETVTITIVDPPEPGFQAHKNSLAGPVPDPAEFCLGETIYFEDTTINPGNSTYLWEFFDEDNDGGGSIGTSTDTDPTFTFNSIDLDDEKLVRLTVTNPDFPSACVKVYEATILITDAPVAGIELRDEFDAVYPNAPNFCQDGSSTFTVEFNDTTSGVDANTRWRWEFYDGSMGLMESIPAGGGNYSSTPITDFTRDFTTEELVTVRLLALNNATGCETTAETIIGIYSTPDVAFSANETCEGDEITFSSIADEFSSLNPRVNDDSVISYQWDFSYDGATFNVEDDRANNDNFDQTFGTAGDFDVALVMRTDIAGCTDTLVQTVTVNPLPNSTFTDDYSSAICPGETINFTNTSTNPSLTVTYDLLIEHTPSGYSNELTNIGAGTSFDFPNPDDSVRTYAVTLEATTDDGCITNSTSANILVNADENAGFSDPTFSFLDANCSPYSSTLVVDANTQSLNPDQYNWDIIDSDDNSISGFPTSKVNTDPDFHELDYEVNNATGSIRNYRIILEVLKTGVCVSNDTFTIMVRPIPNATFTVDKQDACEQVVFTLEADTKGLDDYTWGFDPAPASVIDNDDEQTITYNRESVSGSDINVEISLTTTNLAGCDSETETENEVVEKRSDPVVADFNVSATSLQYPDTIVTLTNTSTGADSYEWNFGNGDESTSAGPIDYAYSSTGTFSITLTASDEYCEDDKSTSVTIQPAEPSVDFEADVVEGCTPFVVNFTNLSTGTVSGEYFWEFGDGNTSREDNPTHTYQAQGVYTVTLRGENSLGTQDEEEKLEYLEVIGTPSSNFTADKVNFCEEVVFTLEAEDQGLTYEWSFDPAPDVQVGTQDKVELTYNRAAVSGSDTYVDISLVVKASTNCVGDSIVHQDTVENLNPALTAAMLLNKDTVKFPDSTVFFGNLSTTGVNYSWDFGNGEVSNAEESFEYSYSQPGSYQVFLTVTDDYCQAVAVEDLVVLPMDPIIDFVADTLEGCSPLTVRFTNLSEGAVPGRFTWDFGDGGVSVADNPTYTYFEGGEFTVRLRGRNSVAVTAEKSREAYIDVAGEPLADFASSPRIVYIPDQSVFFKNLSENGFTYHWDFGDGETSDAKDPQHAYVEEGFYDVGLTVTNEAGCQDSIFRPSEIQAIMGGTVRSPNAFTPSLFGPSGGEVGGSNGDVSTINDVFLPSFEGVVEFRMLIYNKWGQLLFESNSKERGWDGWYNGRPAPAGVYVYKLELGYNDGSTGVEVGDLTLIR